MAEHWRKNLLSNIATSGYAHDWSSLVALVHSYRAKLSGVLLTGCLRHYVILPSMLAQVRHRQLAELVRQVSRVPHHRL